MKMLVFRSLPLLGLVVLLFGLAGCGPATGKISGKVTYKGKPLKGGTVTMFPESGRGPTFASGIEEDGSYSIPNIRTGKYKVVVETKSLKGTSSDSQYGSSPYGKGFGPKGAGGPKGPIKNAPPPGVDIPGEYKMANPAEMNEAARLKRYIEIPENYGKEATTPLTVEVVGGDQTHDINLD